MLPFQFLERKTESPSPKPVKKQGLCDKARLKIYLAKLETEKRTKLCNEYDVQLRSCHDLIYDLKYLTSEEYSINNKIRRLQDDIKTELIKLAEVQEKRTNLTLKLKKLKEINSIWWWIKLYLI